MARDATTFPLPADLIRATPRKQFTRNRQQRVQWAWLIRRAGDRFIRSADQTLRQLMADSGVGCSTSESCWLSPVTDPPLRPALEACAALWAGAICSPPTPRTGPPVANFARVPSSPNTAWRSGSSRHHLRAQDFGAGRGPVAQALWRTPASYHRCICFMSARRLRPAALEARLIAYCALRCAGAGAGRPAGPDGGGARRPATARRGNSAAERIPRRAAGKPAPRRRGADAGACRTVICRERAPRRRGHAGISRVEDDLGRRLSRYPCL